MDARERIEGALQAALRLTESPEGPALLGEALRHAVFPGGARIRPRLTQAVALACGDPHPAATDAVCAAIELLHCASLVHDDLPCFDDAPIRRGRPSVHAAFGERIAVLTGDALIVLAFETIARRVAHLPALQSGLIVTVCRAVGMPSGIVAGQARECERAVPLERYQREKTGALFAGATMAGAAAAGVAPEPWRALGDGIGHAFQIADDILDARSSEDRIGKPVGRDIALDRPSAVRELGLHGAAARLREGVEEAVASIPECPGRAQLATLVRAQALQFVPADLMPAAA